jgi:hypothetical protein
MRLADALEHYRTRAAIAWAIGVSPSAVSQWGDRVPELAAYRLWLASGGRIPLDPRAYQREGRAV